MEEHEHLIKGMVKSSNVKAGSVLEDDSVDIKLSFDGTWQKRGHTSHNGVATAIDVITGYVVDFEMLSNYCIACQNSSAEGDDDYEAFIEIHRPDCQKTTDANSREMEAEAALKI